MLVLASKTYRFVDFDGFVDYDDPSFKKRRVQSTKFHNPQKDFILGETRQGGATSGRRLHLTLLAAKPEECFDLIALLPTLGAAAIFATSVCLQCILEISIK